MNLGTVAAWGAVLSLLVSLVVVLTVIWRVSGNYSELTTTMRLSAEKTDATLQMIVEEIRILRLSDRENIRIQASTVARLEELERRMTRVEGQRGAT